MPSAMHTFHMLYTHEIHSASAACTISLILTLYTYIYYGIVYNTYYYICVLIYYLNTRPSEYSTINEYDQYNYYI